MSNKKLVIKKNKFLEKMKKGKVFQSDKKTSNDLDILRAAAATAAKDRLLFSLDATASREAAWKVATQITKGMFEVIPDKIEVAFAYHGGNRVKEVTPFSKSAKTFLDKLLSVKCEAGHTALNDILNKATQMEGLKAVVYIGDCFEESEEQAYSIARKLKLKGIKLFIFHDKASVGYNVNYAGNVFAGLVDVTGGAVMDFNDQAIKEAEEILRAVTIYAIGGRKLLKQKQGTEKGVVALLEHLK